MKGLRIKYENENGEIIEHEYDKIKDFVQKMESNAMDIPMLDYRVIEAEFSVNELRHKIANKENGSFDIGRLMYLLADASQMEEGVGE